MGPVFIVMWDVKVAIFCCFFLRCSAKDSTLLNELHDAVHASPTTVESTGAAAVTIKHVEM